LLLETMKIFYEITGES